MIGVQRAIFPGFLFGCICLVFITGLISRPARTLASSLPVQDSGGIQVEDAASQTGPTVSVDVVEQPEQEASQPECSLSPAFPESIRQWCGSIERYAGENGLDPDLIASVMLQESGGNADAYSKSGAVGLMQVMPRDGLAASFTCINGPCFASRPSMSELYDPEFNIQYGTSMLAGLINRYGDVREALKAYGPMNYGYRYADIILNIKARYE